MPKTQTPITEKIKSLDDARKFLGITEFSSVPFPFPLNPLEKSANAYMRLVLIIRALNEGWLPNLGDPAQLRFIPAFYVLNGKFQFRHIDRPFGRSIEVDPKLMFATKELAEYASKQFFNDYKEYFAI